MSDTRGVFILADAINYNLSDEWVDSNDAWIQPIISNSGYFVSSGIADKLNYSSEITARVPSISIPGLYISGTSNFNSGYFGGENTTPGVNSRLDKVNYSTDTLIATPSVNLSIARSYLAATGNSTAGYFGGGDDMVPSGFSTVDKVTYSTDTVSTPNNAALTRALSGLSATGNLTHGYFGGGVTLADGRLYSNMDKLEYAIDTTLSAPGANLIVPFNQGSSYISATGNATVGYFGGLTGPGYSVMTKITYSSDTASSPATAGLSGLRSGLAATGNSTEGYFGGGRSSGFQQFSTMEKVTYSNDTSSAVPGGALTSARYGLGAASARANALESDQNFNIASRFSDNRLVPPNTGYFGGGTIFSPYSVFSTIEKVNFSADIRTATPGLALITARNAASVSSGTHSYFTGGQATGAVPPTYISLTEKVAYSNDTESSVPGASLVEARDSMGAVGNSVVGYFDGGASGLDTPTLALRTLEKIYFSNDTLLYYYPGHSAQAPYQHNSQGTTSSSTGAYFIGGFNTPSFPILSSVDKLTYSTEVRTQIPGASLSIARSGGGATGNSSVGYFGGGGVPGPSVFSTINKITYSNDTGSAVPSATLSAARSLISACGNSDSGYFGGSFSYSIFDKLNYSTDTVSSLPGARLSISRNEVSSSSGRSNAFPQPPASTPTPLTTPNTGYFGGGGTPNEVSSMDKLNYSSDTTIAVPSASLSFARRGLAATGNSNSGYFGGGIDSPAIFSSMDKVTYSSDTTATVPGASLSVARFVLAATGNLTSGYFGGGHNIFPTFTSTSMDKVTYSTDTTVAVPGASLSFARRGLAATGNSTAGYFGGGFGTGGANSTMDKVNYSSDTTAAVPGASLSAARYNLAATGNLTAGYFGGGFSGLFSTMDKVTYSSDTTAAVPGAALTAARLYLSASSARANALPSSVLL